MLAGKQVFLKGRTMVDTETDSAARLRAVIGKLSRRLRPTLAGGGLTPTRISVLFTVVRLGPLRISQLAEIEGLNPTMLSRVIAQLSADGLVRRLPDPDDRRAAIVEATAAGSELRARIRHEREDALSVHLGGLSDADRAVLERALPVLEQLTEALKDRRA
jgi:DNA-binding MarR family transcriptional regulator